MSSWGPTAAGADCFRSGAWSVLRTANPKVSFQLYTMLSYHDRLLMGQYPTGELFEIAGDEVRQIPGWPPRMPGASANAREAQTLAIYRGELFAGVWPGRGLALRRPPRILEPCSPPFFTALRNGKRDGPV